MVVVQVGSVKCFSSGLSDKTSLQGPPLCQMYS